jgi:hypothetical protein
MALEISPLLTDSAAETGTNMKTASAFGLLENGAHLSDPFKTILLSSLRPWEKSILTGTNLGAMAAHAKIDPGHARKRCPIGR